MYFSNSRRTRAQRGFTLMEILVAIAILGLLAGLAINHFGGTLDQARNDTAKLFVTSTIKMPLFSYKMKMGDFPSTSEGLQALVTAPSNSRSGAWSGPYLDPAKVPVDPWGRPYEYAYPGTHNKGGYDVWSKGLDGQSGTSDDIGNWEESAAPQQ